MPLSPPVRSTGLLADMRHFLLRRPQIPTSIVATSSGEREDYTHRIRQRIGICVADYSVLNIHRIGIDAPVSLVFEELDRWDGTSSCWPNHLAHFERVNGFENVRILLFGLPFVPLFRLNALKTQSVPDAMESDSARYVVFQCSGGYPMGIFAAYARSSIAELGEVEPTQFFMVVGFDFYGKGRSRRGPIGMAWESIHNRVTSNVMNRFKALCEWRFEKIRGGG